MGRIRYILERKEHSIEPWDTGAYSRGTRGFDDGHVQYCPLLKDDILFLRKNGRYKQETV